MFVFYWIMEPILYCPFNSIDSSCDVACFGFKLMYCLSVLSVVFEYI